MDDDLIDALIAEWGATRPDFDTSGMEVVGRIIMLGHLMSISASDVLKIHNISYTDFDILATLCRQGPPYALTPSVLSRAVLLTSGAMTTALDRLERAGLITRRPSEEDRRSSVVSLTPRGRSTAEKAAVDRFGDAASWVADMPAEKRQRLAELLKSIITNPDRPA
ncbi:MAG: MarR family transcriptional regulator [Pseudomonadota bacterium]